MCRLVTRTQGVPTPLNHTVSSARHSFLQSFLANEAHSSRAGTLFSGAEFGVNGGSRIVLLGENGNGKTTLVKLMMGVLQPTAGHPQSDTSLHLFRARKELTSVHMAGEVIIASGVRIALVNQHHADQIDLNQTPLFYLRQLYRGDGSRSVTL